MSADRLLFTGLPAILTLAIHGGLVLMLVVRWTGPSEVIAAAPSIQFDSSQPDSGRDVKAKTQTQTQTKAET